MGKKRWSNVQTGGGTASVERRKKKEETPRRGFTREKPQILSVEHGARLHAEKQEYWEPEAETQQQNAGHSRGGVVRRGEAAQAEVQGQVPHPLHRWGVAKKHCGRTEK